MSAELINIVATVMRASSHRFVGRLGRDPEMKCFDSGKSVVNASIGINIPGSKQGDGKQPDWFKIEIWGEDGQAFADQCRKGDLVEVIGRVRTNRWTDGQGQPRLDLVVTADHWSLVRSSGQAAGTAPAAPAPMPAAVAPAPHLAAAGWQPAAAPVAENDIPF
jgi:single-strand DNA-binding protein